MKATKHVVAVMAHPDDIEILCAGTLIQLRQKGYGIHLVTMTSGDCGSAEHGPEEICRIRSKEAARAAAVIGATYDCVGCRDLFVTFDRPTIQRVTEILRRYNPFLVITHSPQCYMLDHEETAKIARTATFGVAIPNFKTEAIDPAPCSTAVPYFYYADAVEHKNQFGERVKPQFYVDISGVIETKAKMLKRHASQRDWLRKHHHMDEYIIKMKEMSAENGREAGVKYAEAFRQHLGHGYPQDNILGKILGELRA